MLGQLVGGQSGLVMGYHLSRRGLRFAIVDANDRIGDAWRNRWDSLRLFTPNRLNGLPGMPFPGYHWGFPSKNEMADYLESYARRFDVRVETGVRVERLSRDVDASLRLPETDGPRPTTWWLRCRAGKSPGPRKARVPGFAGELDPGIVQLHVADDRNPGQLQEEGVLIVGAGNSGAEVAKELARTHDVWLSGPDTGNLPFRRTLIGSRARPKLVSIGEPLIRVKPKDLAEAGVERVPRVTGVQHGQPRLEDGRRIEVANVVWSTGFDPGFSWIDLPVLDEGAREPNHRRGVLEDMPGHYFVGLKFLYSVSSEQIHGVGRDAARIADARAARRGESHSDLPVANHQEQNDSAQLQRSS